MTSYTSLVMIWLLVSVGWATRVDYEWHPGTPRWIEVVGPIVFAICWPVGLCHMIQKGRR